MPANIGEVRLSIVIPTYKERVRLPRTLREMTGYLLETFKDFEILVVDDNSPDGTIDSVFAPESNIHPDILRRIRGINQGRRYGKGAAVRRGFEEATGDAVMFIDADHATRIEYASEAVTLLLSGNHECVAGLRMVPDDHPMGRRIVSLGLLFLTHVISFDRPVMDSQCGFKVFTSRVAKRLAAYCRVDTGLIDVEMFSLLQKWDVSYGYIAVKWQHDASSRIDVKKAVVRDLGVLARIALDHRFGRYEKPLPLGKRCWDAGLPSPTPQVDAPALAYGPINANDPRRVIGEEK